MSKPDVVVMNARAHDEGFLFENGKLRDATGVGILGKAGFLACVTASAYLGVTGHCFRMKEFTAEHPFDAFSMELGVEPKCVDGHYVFYVSDSILDSIDTAECLEGDFVLLKWPGIQGETVEAWVRIWRVGQIEISGNEAWFGMPCEAPVVFPVEREADQA